MAITTVKNAAIPLEISIEMDKILEYTRINQTKNANMKGTRNQVKGPKSFMLR